jgi:hypothetical protein
MTLRREVLPPRSPPREPCDFEAAEQFCVSEDQLRASITRTIWRVTALIGLSHVLMRVLEMQ